MNPTPSAEAAANFPKAVQAAAKEIEDVVASVINPRALIREIITRHIEPIVRATRDGLVAACGDLIREGMERDQALAKLAEVEKERDELRDSETQAHAELGNIGPKLVHALSRLSQSDALLREALGYVSLQGHEGPSTEALREEYPEAAATVDDLRSRISAHLATATTKEGK